MSSAANLRQLFLIDPEVVFLNHGSFGACPKPVFEKYQDWQLQLEHQPLEFLGRRYPTLMADARFALGAFLGTSGENLFFTPNTTTGINTVIRSLPLSPGDEVLSNTFEYGALHRAWEFVCKKQGAKYRQCKIDLPIESKAQFIEVVWRHVNKKTKVLFLSHITSSNALTLPVAALISRAREQGIITIIDGAHAPGQIPLNLDSLNADFYAGNCHKWLMAPKGSAFLYAHPEMQSMVDPLVVSWDNVSAGTSRFLKENEFQGTRDIAAYLTVPAAIDFFQENNWPEIQTICHALVKDAREGINAIFEQDAICPDEGGWFQQMSAHSLPKHVDGTSLQEKLLRDYNIEIPVMTIGEDSFLRISMQGYNTREDVNILLESLRKIIG